MPDIVFKLLSAAIGRSCAVGFEPEQAPFFRQVVDLDLLLCTGFNSEHDDLFLCHISTQRPMNKRKMDQSYGRCFGLQQYCLYYYFSKTRDLSICKSWKPGVGLGPYSPYCQRPHKLSTVDHTAEGLNFCIFTIWQLAYDGKLKWPLQEWKEILEFLGLLHHHQQTSEAVSSIQRNDFCCSAQYMCKCC